MKFLQRFALVTLGIAAEAQASPPNVIIVITDDQGYGEMSIHGNPVIETPNLDLLARQSVRLNDFHASPMCTPTRGQLMTGIDSARNGSINVSGGRALLRSHLPTIADIFQKNGYATGQFGKWHLGDNFPYRPEDRGFEETVWFPSSHIGSAPDFWGNDYFDDTYIHNGKRQAYRGYCTDVFFQEAITFMQRSVRAGKPFFTYLATNTPHSPYNPKEEDRAAIEMKLARPEFAKMGDDLKRDLSKYLGMVRNIDTNMGQLMRFLDEAGLRNDTVLIFMTDNGTIRGQLYFNAGMRGMKTELWEGGHRVPFFISWPKGGLVGPREIGGLTQVQDVLPTLLDLCGIETPASRNFDGVSLLSVLRGLEKVQEDRILIIEYSRMPSGFNYPSPYSQSILKRDQAAVLWKRWRLLEDRELYDLASDPMQTTNVIAQHPEVVAKMRKVLYSWWDRVAPLANEPQRVIIGNDAENPTMLTACEWLDVFVDQQRQIQQGVRKSGYWLLDVAQAGEYEFELRRWPKELDKPLVDGLDAMLGSLPIRVARMFISDYQHLSISEKRPYGFEGLSQVVNKGDKAAVFRLPLKRGPIALHTWFDSDNDTLCSAYYVYVRRL